MGGTCAEFLVLRQMSHQRVWLLLYSWAKLQADPSSSCLATSCVAGPGGWAGVDDGWAAWVAWCALLVACPDLLVAMTLWCRLRSQPKQLSGPDEGIFVSVSLLHLIASGLGNLSLVCKQRRVLSLRGWCVEGAAIVVLEFASAIIATTRVGTLWLLSVVPFGGRHLAAFLRCSGMGISTLVMLCQLPELFVAAFKPLGWSDSLQPASRRLASLARSLEAWLRELARGQHQHHHAAGPVGVAVGIGLDRHGAVARRHLAAGVMPPPHMMHMVHGGGPGGAAFHLARGEQPAVVNWPPKLPSSGPPLTSDELERLTAAHPSLVCPVSHAVPLEPAVSASGATFDRESIMAAVRATGRDPVTNVPCTTLQLRPNYALRTVIDDYISKMRSAAPPKASSEPAHQAGPPPTPKEEEEEQQAPLPPPVRETQSTTPRRRRGSKRPAADVDPAASEAESLATKRLRPLPSRKRPAAAT